MISTVFDNYYPSLYSEGATVRCVSKLGSTKTGTYNHNSSFEGWLRFHSNIRDKGTGSPLINTYIEKYPNESAIDKLVLDFDMDDAGDKSIVGNYVMKLSNYLKELKISHFIEDSTNKGYHVFIFLGKDYNFNINKRFKYNNKMFKAFVYNLLGDYTEFLDDVNVGMKTNIRMLGSVHPKTGKCVSPVLMKDYNYNSHPFIEECYYNAMDSVPEIKYHGHWKEVVDYKGGFIDLRTLPWDNVKRASNNSIWCCCPWHDDKSPSLRVYEKSAFCMKCGPVPFSKVCDYFGIKRGGDNKC